MNTPEFHRLVRRVKKASDRLGEHLDSARDHPDARQMLDEYRAAIEAMTDYYARHQTA